ncbi:MAG: putative hydroxymethylpyrimidine transporter CytX [Verrucomicrobia bacterium]|nr:putative hydroxymethylpyrimidine transporter CytX [Verrucomicrobiota bacterium]
MDFFVLWMGASISLAEIWAGGLLAPLGFIGGLVAIVLGHVIGNTPMALGGIIGSRHGVPAMISTRGALGIRGSYLPAVLNCIQLIGWTAVMLWICGHTAAQVAGASWPAGARIWILGAGILTTLWALTGHGIRKWLQRTAVVLLTLLSILMTLTIFRRYGFVHLLDIRPTGALSFGQGLDLVIAMPISWLPLVSDYSRFAQSTRGSFWGTWWGYLLAGSWMYAVGLCAALASQTASPDSMVMGLMAEIGLVGPALLIVILSTVTTTFLDIYSNAVSVRSLAPKLNERAVIAIGGLAGTLLAMFFPATEYQTFLLFIGAMFCPLFGVVLADYFILKRMRFETAGTQDGRRPAYWKGIHLTAIAAWAAGFALFKLAERCGWTVGASLPGMLGAAALYLLAAPLVRRVRQGAAAESAT